MIHAMSSAPRYHPFPTSVALNDFSIGVSPSVATTASQSCSIELASPHRNTVNPSHCCCGRGEIHRTTQLKRVRRRHRASRVETPLHWHLSCVFFRQQRLPAPLSERPVREYLATRQTICELTAKARRWTVACEYEVCRQGHGIGSAIAARSSRNRWLSIRNSANASSIESSIS